MLKCLHDLEFFMKLANESYSLDFNINSKSFKFQCDCDGEPECQVAKTKIQACKDSVLYANRNDTIVNCNEAQWICQADAECGKALEYYNLLCRSMFKGKKCTERCKNSINILRRQDKAAKLSHCHCQPNEYLDEFLCSDIKQNMENLCFEPEIVEETTLQPIVEIIDVYEDSIDTNEIDVDEKLNKISKGIRSYSGNYLFIFTVILKLILFEI